MYRFLDKAMIYVFSINSNDEESYYKFRDALERKQHILYDMDLIDSKSSALLAHVSIMLAVVGALLYSVISDEHYFLSLLLKIEILAYAIVTLLLLRCVDIIGPPLRMLSDSDSADEYYIKELTLRRSIYQLSVRVVFILTAILIVMAALKVFG